MSRLASIQNLFVGLLDKSENKPTNSPAAPSAIAKLLPKDNEWLNNLHQKANPNFADPPEKTEESFWVKLPPKPNARIIRENLLRENFGFEKADIAAYDRETKNKGFFVSDSGRPDKWATTGEIGNWNIRGGYVEISMPKEKAAELRNFRVSRVIDKSLASIGDPFLRAAVKKDLMAATAGEGFDKTEAADRLLNLEVENPADAEAVRNSIRTAAKQPENQNNAVIQIVSAKVDLAAVTKEMSKTAFKNPQDAENLRRKISDYEYDLEKTARLAGGFNKISDAQAPNLKTNREEAVWANRQAADIYRQLGNEGKADEREMMARYYRVDEAERNSLAFKIGKSAGDGFPILKVIPRNGEGASSMSATNGDIPRDKPPTEPSTKELSEEPFKLETRKYEKTYKIVETTWRNGKPTTEVQKGVVKGYERNFQMEGSLKVEGTKTTKQYESNDKRGEQVRREIYTTSTRQSPELNPGGTTRASIAAGGVLLTEDWNKWMNFKSQGNLATQRIAAQDKAQFRAFLRDNYPQPPAPKDLPKMKYELETYLGKEKAKEAMKFIEEASYAVYGRK